MSDEHPELSGYEPYEDKPLRTWRKSWVLRMLVIVGIIALVLPGFVTTVSVGTSNAVRACAYRVALVDPALESAPRFEIFGPGGIGWECYAIDRFDGESHIDSMGLIPVAPRAPQGPTENA